MLREGRTFYSDKKLNARYWDDIDGEVEELLNSIAQYSTTSVSEEIPDCVAEVRDVVIKCLKQIGGTFPYVEGNM